MKKAPLTGILAIISLIAVLALSGCQSSWKEVHSVEIGKNDAELKAVVQNFVLTEDADPEELISRLETNKQYAEGDYLAYLDTLIEYNTRIKNAADNFRGRYFAACLEYLTETGCDNTLTEVEALFRFPAEDVQEIEVVDEKPEEGKATVRLVANTPGTDVMRIETYYLRQTADGWKVYDVFDYNTKKAVSDVPKEEIERQQNLQVFRLRAKLERMAFPSEEFEADDCVKEFTQEYVFTKETNEKALECYKTYFEKARRDYSVCGDIFPKRYEAICQGIGLAHNGGNCTTIIDKAAYESPTYGMLTTSDICNFYYSMEMSAQDGAKAKENCLHIQSPKYRAKCWETFEPKEEAVEA